ncbi:LOW QUALITY PROTEIN: sodium-coupled monocarboxylate transporter 1-like [Trichosurus vulpecula]|uniref:LOW QUALITY PROTEIN: sodium-coupled monocarboxylate transporter 1-like n=1 Tax=Trichosurus vulpecula TaxID=9337 RepID=UPI00186B381A|nr:LOW QUALITY PROTEIN: sodium-coupled monocarboxylate transporter 1-like [Trichosurus vulpecula]
MSTHQETGTFGVWDYLVFAGILLISAAIGVYYAFSRGGQQTPKDFMMGGRKMTATPVALSLTASFVSSIAVLGTLAEVYRFGAIISTWAITQVLVVLITAEVFLPVFYRLEITSTYEYLELCFNKHIHLCGTILFIFQMSSVTGFNLWGAIIVTGVVCTFYCTMGGFKAVIWTDVFQVGIMVAGLLSVIIQAAEVQGGINKILNDSYHGGRLNFWDFNPNPLQRYSFWTIIIGGTFTSTSIYGINQSQVQRYIACKSRFQAKMSLYINLVGQWTILACTIFCGLAIYSRYHECDPWTSKKISAPDQLMPHLVSDIMRDYSGLPGLFVACVYGGTLSTVSSSINALALVTIIKRSSFSNLIKPHFRLLSDETVSWLLKGTSVLYGVLCIGMAALASLVGFLLQASVSIFVIIGRPLLGLFSLGILAPFVNSMGAFAGLAAGSVISLWIGIGAQLYPPLPERTLPLSLITNSCNITDFHHQGNWNTTTETPFSTSTFQVHDAERTPLMDNCYSISYMHFSTIGTLITLLAGIIVSLLTGGRKQSLDDRLLLTKDDFLSNFDFFKREKLILNSQPYTNEDGGTVNPTFNYFEMYSTEGNRKTS